MAYIAVPYQAGVFTDDTPLAAASFFVSTDKIRFVRDKAQVIGGWEKASNDTVQGIQRGIHTWLDENAQGYAAFGSATYVQAYFDGEIYDITPIDEIGVLTNPFTTSLGSATVSVTDATHGRTAGDRVLFDGASAAGGLTIDGEYTVASVVDANTFTITASTLATASTLGGGTVDYDYYIPAGLVDSLGGAGYGTGGYGSGAYGTSTTTIYYARTWSLDNWNQNLIASPRGGKIYEWAPKTAVTELITNGDFASGGTWTLGTGWTISSGRAVGTLISSELSQSVSIAPAAYFLLEFDLTVAAGTIYPKIGTSSFGAGITTTGRYRRIMSGSSLSSTSTFAFGTTSFTGTVDNVSLSQLVNLYQIPNSPSENTVVMVTPQQILMACGTIDIDTGLFDPLLIRWSDTELNYVWTPTSANLAGFYKLAVGGRIVGADITNSEILIWTDTALYAGRFIPDPNIVYDFTLRGTGCGLFGPNAASVLGGVAYWMSPSGEFWMYAGGAPMPLQSTVRRYVYDNLAQVQQDKIYSFPVAAWSEVYWLYADARDGNECSRYVSVNTKNQWAVGTFDRSAWVDAGPIPYAMACDLTGSLYFQEKGNSANGANISWSARTGAIDLGDGSFLMQVNAYVPDFDDLLGGCTISPRTYLYPNSTPNTLGPYNVTSALEKVDFFAVGRQIDYTFAGNAAPAFGRFGIGRLDVISTGMTN